MQQQQRAAIIALRREIAMNVRVERVGHGRYPSEPELVLHKLTSPDANEGFRRK
jgi:hypothetical protein